MIAGKLVRVAFYGSGLQPYRIASLTRQLPVFSNELRANLPAGGGGDKLPFKFLVGPLAGLVILTECDRGLYANWLPVERIIPLVLYFVGVWVVDLWSTATRTTRINLTVQQDRITRILSTVLKRISDNTLTSLLR